MEKKTTEITAEEAAEFQAYKEWKAKEEAAEKAKQDREAYKKLVDETLEVSIPLLSSISEGIKDTKQNIIDQFRAAIDMKTDILRLTKDSQRSHTFTNTIGDKRITIGMYVTDGYRDTVEEGILIVKEYIEGLASDEKTKSLVAMVLRLLARDVKGTLKASRVVQLRKIAEESRNERFLEGVRIIEEAYQPAISKQFIRAEIKDKNNAWVVIPLGMTEA